MAEAKAGQRDSGDLPAFLGYSDEARTIAAVKAAEGKRLTYHQPR